MEMIEVKTGELVGPALRYAVMVAIAGHLRAEHAPLEGKDYQRVCLPAGFDDHGLWFEAAHPAWAGTAGCRTWRPDEDWAQGGPLRDKYKVAVYEVQAGGVAASLRGDEPEFWIDEADFEADATGSTALIAICRAIVAAKLGDTVRVPAALVGGMA